MIVAQIESVYTFRKNKVRYGIQIHEPFELTISEAPDGNNGIFK